MRGVKAVRKGNIKDWLWTIVSVLMIAFLIFVLFKLNNDKEKTISITTATRDIYTNQAISKDALSSYEMSLSEYNKSQNKYLLWEEHEEALDQYSAVFTKKNAYLYKGDYNPTKPVKNEWLAKVGNEDLVISVPYDKNDAFGNILTPGDNVKVNVSYMREKSGDDQGFSTTTVEVANETLFERIQVIDLLNSSGNSIYDYYMDLLAMPVSEREKYLRDDSFLSNVSPTRMLVEITNKGDFEAFSRMKSYSSLKYTYGLFSRVEEDTVLEQFRDLTRQITSSQTSVKEGEKQ